MTDRTATLAGPRRGAARWLPPMGVLALGTALAVITRAVPVVTTADGSSAAPAVGTGWVVVLPLLVALVMTTTCADGTLGVIAGAGSIAVGRLVSDLGLFFSPDAVLRPELFGVDSVAGFPLSTAWGAVFPVLGDLLAVVAAVLAARYVLDGYELPDLGAPVPASSSTDVRDRPRPFRANPATFVGVMAVVLVIASSFGVLYAAPTPVVRPLGLADVGLFGAAGAVAGGLVLCLVAVVGPALPPRSARGVFLGAGAAAAVAPLIALLAGGDTRPSGLAWVGFVGAVLLAVTGLLVRDDPTVGDRPTAPAEIRRDDPAGPVTLWLRIAPVGVAVLTLLAGGAALLAYREPQATTLIGEQLASFDAAGAAFLPAAVLLLAIGVLALVPPTAALARRALRLGWLPVVAAVLITLEFSASSIWVSSAVFTAGGVTRAAGSWWGIAAAGAAIVAAVVAAVVDARLADRDAAAVLDPLDEPDAVRRLRISVGWVLTVLAVAALAVPVFGANDRPSAALFVAGSRVDTYAAWLLALGLIAGIWAGVLSRTRTMAATLLGTVALVALTRVALTPAVAHQVRFELRAGFAITLVLALAAIVAAVVLVVRTAPVAAPVPRPAARPGPARSPVAPRGKRA